MFCCTHTHDLWWWYLSRVRSVTFSFMHWLNSPFSSLTVEKYKRNINIIHYQLHFKLNRACYYWNYLLIYRKFPMMLIHHSADWDLLFNTQSRVLQADWLVLENNEKATLNMNTPYCNLLCRNFTMKTIDTLVKSKTLLRPHKKRSIRMSGNLGLEIGIGSIQSAFRSMILFFIGSRFAHRKIFAYCRVLGCLLICVGISEICAAFKLFRFLNLVCIN